MNKLLRFIKDRPFRISILASRGFYDRMSDEKFLKMKYRAIFGRELDLEDPKTYNEKLQWLKLYDREDIYTTMVDKYEAKKYVADIIGEEYVIPTLGVWDKFEDIDFDALPEKFVLKTTHDSGGIVICRDKAAFNIEKARAKLTTSLKRRYYSHSREWPYKNVKPRILAEQYMEDAATAELRDYKLYCFDGEVKSVMVATGRQSADGVHTDFFDEDFVHFSLTHGHPNADIPPEKPANFERMKELAGVLSKGIPHLRVDFYDVNGKIYFGELTFSSSGGFVPFDPPEWDEKFGSLIILPSRR